MGHTLKDYQEVSSSIKQLPKDDLPFSIAPKAESNLIGKLSRNLGISGKKKKAAIFVCGEEEIKANRVKPTD